MSCNKLRATTLSVPIGQTWSPTSWNTPAVLTCRNAGHGAVTRSADPMADWLSDFGTIIKMRQRDWEKGKHKLHNIFGSVCAMPICRASISLPGRIIETKQEEAKAPLFSLSQETGSFFSTGHQNGQEKLLQEAKTPTFASSININLMFLLPLLVYFAGAICELHENVRKGSRKKGLCLGRSLTYRGQSSE